MTDKISEMLYNKTNLDMSECRKLAIEIVKLFESSPHHVSLCAGCERQVSKCICVPPRDHSWIAQPDGIPVENSKYPYPHEDWAGTYDPYADVVLGRVDRYFEDDQGIVDTVVIK